MTLRLSVHPSPRRPSHGLSVLIPIIIGVTLRKHRAFIFIRYFCEDWLVGTVHCETDKGTLYLSVVVFEEFQNKGIGSEVLGDILAGRLDIPFDVIRVSMDVYNFILRQYRLIEMKTENVCQMILYKKISNFHSVGK